MGLRVENFVELFFLCKSLSTLADLLPEQFLLCSDFLHAVKVSQSHFILKLCMSCLFEWSFEVALYCTPGYVGTHGNVAVLTAVTDTSLQGPFISFKFCINEGTLL